MAYYLLQLAYTSQGWNALLQKPQNRLEAVKPAVKALGGKIEDGWFSFGEYDIVLVIQMPDNVSAAALSMAFAAGGALKTVRTTPLLPVTEGIEAMKKASKSGYRPA